MEVNGQKAYTIEICWERGGYILRSTSLSLSSLMLSFQKDSWIWWAASSRRLGSIQVS